MNRRELIVGTTAIAAATQLPMAYAAQVPYALDLRDLMDAQYGVGAWAYRTGVGIGSDIGPAVAAGVAAIKATMVTGRGIILIPPGQWLMNTSPGNLAGIRIVGAGSQASVITYNSKVMGPALPWLNSPIHGTGGGCRGIALLLERGLGDTNATGILLRGDAVHQPDQTEWDDIYMSAIGGVSHWWDGFHADGSARSAPQGIRVATINNLQIFNCHNVGFYGANLVQWTLNNVGAYTGAGPYGDMIQIVSGSTHVYGTGINGVLDTSGSIDVMINGTRYS